MEAAVAVATFAVVWLAAGYCDHDRDPAGLRACMDRNRTGSVCGSRELPDAAHDGNVRVPKPERTQPHMVTLIAIAPSAYGLLTAVRTWRPSRLEWPHDQDGPLNRNVFPA